MTARLHLFGSPTIEVGGARLALPFERRSQLLVFLALKRSWVGRPELAALLWPEQASKLAYTNLRKTLFRLQSLAWAPAIDSQGGALRLDADTDVAQFESALRDGRAADAVRLRRGELLAGFDGSGEAWSSWLAFERERLRAAWRTAALDRLATDIDPTEAIELSAQLLGADPLDEAALRAHMQWLARSGQGARARDAYRAFAQRLAQELGLAPGAELSALHDSLGTAVVVPVAPEAPPAADAGFVGRAVELRRIAALLAQDDCRLLTLVGPGGAGKTRLARRTLQELAPRFADGAVFVALEDLSAPAEIGARLARELDLKLAGGDPLAHVIRHIGARRLLLALDNFEPLTAGAPLLEQLLRGCAGLKIVVTSRVRLALASEWLLPVEGLPCPEPEDLDHIDAFDAVRLFVQAARRVEPTLSPASEAAAIIDICRQVEGLPLALELAAAWVRVLPCAAIAAELRRGTELLRSVDPAHPQRHASIESVFDQSWRLLSPVEREALARLSAFHGGFTAEAARAVAGTALPVLGALNDKSLLRKDGARLAMHPLVQQFAAARLGDGEAAQATHAAHAAYFHRQLAQLKAAVGAGERAALRWIDDEYENCRRAWHWSVARGETEALARSSATLLDFWDYRGRFEDGLALLRAAIDAPLGPSAQAFRALVLSRIAHLEYRLDRYDEAEADALQAMAATNPRLGPSETARQANIVLATCAFRRGRLAEAKRYFERTLQLATPGSKAHALAVSYDHLALIEKALGRYDEALRLSLQSLAEHQRLGDRAGEALCLNNLGSLYLLMNENDAAGAQLHQALAICERDGLVSARGLVLANLAEVALRAADLDRADAYSLRALDVAAATGHRAVTAWVNTKRARIATRRGDLDGARRALAEGLALAISLGVASVKFDALLGFVELLAAQGETACAERVAAFATEQPAATAAIRDQFRQRLDPRPDSLRTHAGWPGIDFDDLLNRIVAEAPLAHAPLTAALRGGR